MLIFPGPIKVKQFETSVKGLLEGIKQCPNPDQKISEFRILLVNKF